MQVRTSMAIVASTGFGVDVDVDFPASNGTASNSSSHSTPSSMSSTSSPSASLGNRVVTAFQVILDASRPSNTGFWLPVFLMLHPACRWPVRLLAWVRCSNSLASTACITDTPFKPVGFKV